MQFTIIHRYVDDPRFTVLLGKVNAMVLSLAQLTTDVTALTAAVTSVDSDLAGLRTQIASLTATIAAGGTITQAQIDALDGSVSAAVTNWASQAAQDAPQAAAPVVATTLTTDAPKS